MRYQDLLKNYSNLEKNSLLSIIHSITGEDKATILANPEKELSKSSLAKLVNAIKRLEQEEPLAYILGEKEFYGLNFKVNRYTLIPRPETEILVDLVVRNIDRESKKMLNVLEVGTGSGCIVISILHELQNSPTILSGNFKVTLTDLSEKALKIARTNIENLLPEGISRQISTQSCDVINVSDRNKYNFLVSNPPYIPTSEITTLSKNVRDYEPHLALDGGEDGLKIYREILNKTKDNLTQDAIILFEVHEELAQQVVDLIKTHYPQASTQIHQDYSKKDRFVEATCLISNSKLPDY